MERNVLLTGANGFLGSHLVPELVKHGCRVQCLIRPRREESSEQRMHSALQTACTDSNEAQRIMNSVVCVEGDFSAENFGMDQQRYRDLLNTTHHIIHNAAMTTFSTNQEKEQWIANVDGTINMLRFAADCSSADGLHYVSTAYVAGDRTDLAYEDELDTGQGFYNGYERSKFHAEKRVQEYRAGGLPVTVYRPSIIVGNSESGRTVLFNGMYLFLRFLQSAKLKFDDIRDGKTYMPIRCPGNPDATKNYVHIDYVVNTMIAIFSRPETHGRTYHLTHPDPPRLDILRLAIEQILDVTGARFVPEEDFEKQPPSELEEMMQEQVRIYLPYLFTEPSFDKTNIEQALPGDSAPECRPMDLDSLVDLFSYAINSRWGKRKKRRG